MSSKCTKQFPVFALGRERTFRPKNPDGIEFSCLCKCIRRGWNTVENRPISTATMTPPTAARSLGCFSRKIGTALWEKAIRSWIEDIKNVFHVNGLTESSISHQAVTTGTTTALRHVALSQRPSSASVSSSSPCLTLAVLEAGMYIAEVTENGKTGQAPARTFRIRTLPEIAKKLSRKRRRILRTEIRKPTAINEHAEGEK